MLKLLLCYVSHPIPQLLRKKINFPGWPFFLFEIEIVGLETGMLLLYKVPNDWHSLKVSLNRWYCRWCGIKSKSKVMDTETKSRLKLCLSNIIFINVNYLCNLQRRMSLFWFTLSSMRYLLWHKYSSDKPCIRNETSHILFP